MVTSPRSENLWPNIELSTPSFRQLLQVTEADVKRILTLPAAIELAREAYNTLAQRNAINPQRITIMVPGGASMYFMPGYVHGQKTAIVKVARVNADNSKASVPSTLVTIYVYDAVTGIQVAELEAELLTAVRTAASSAVATDVLARRDAKVLGVFGSGVEARSHIHAIKLVRDFHSVLVFSRDSGRRHEFARQLSGETGLLVEAVDSPATIASRADVIVTATTSQTPVFSGKLVRSGTLVVAIGGSTPNAQEVDTDLVKRSIVVVDSREQALFTYGTIITPLNEGAIHESEIVELGDLLSKKTTLHSSGKDVTLFNAGGLAVLDAIVTDHILKSLSKDTVS